MRPAPQPDLYSPREIAIAAGVPETAVREALGAARELVSFDEAVRVGRRLVQPAPPAETDGSPVVRLATPAAFPGARPAAHRVEHVPRRGHGGALFATFNLSPRAAALRVDDKPADPMRLVFLATPGPGGGGGGGGLLQKAPAPKALREGTRRISSPLPARVEPKPVVAVPSPPEPKPEPPLVEQLPVVVAPIITAPADTRNRVGVLTQTTVETENHGPAPAAAPAPAEERARRGRWKRVGPIGGGTGGDRIGPAAASRRRGWCAK